jgi:hypothetical protein
MMPRKVGIQIWRESLRLEQAIVLVVGTPAVKLLHGNGKHANPSGDENACLDEMLKEVLLASLRTQEGDRLNAPD